MNRKFNFFKNKIIVLDELKLKIANSQSLHQIQSMKSK